MSKRDEARERVSVVRRWDHGLTWAGEPSGRLERTSHALEVNGDVWLVDPVAWDGLEAQLDPLGTVRGVVVLSSNHQRDADVLADRYDVAVHVPAWFDHDEIDIDAPVERLQDELATTGFELVPTADGAFQEGALYHPGRQTLVVGDILTTTLLGRGERLAVFPFVRLFPPRKQLGGLAVERVLVGHGGGVVDGAQEALDTALVLSRRRTPSSLLFNAPMLARIVLGEVRRTVLGE